MKIELFALIFVHAHIIIFFFPMYTWIKRSLDRYSVLRLFSICSAAGLVLTLLVRYLTKAPNAYDVMLILTLHLAVPLFAWICASWEIWFPEKVKQPLDS